MIRMRVSRSCGCKEYTYLGVKLCSGAALLDGAIRERCTAAEAMCTQWAEGDSSRANQASEMIKTQFFLSEVASRRDYGLLCLRLSEAQLKLLQTNDATCTRLLRITLRGRNRFHCRVANKKAKLAGKLAAAGRWTWRHLLWRAMVSIA